MLIFNCDNIHICFINLYERKFRIKREYIFFHNKINENSLACSYAYALALVASGKINVKPLITHNFQIEETVKAFDISKSPDSGAVKVMIHLK